MKIWTNFKIDKIGTQTNGLKDKDDYIQSLTHERRHRFYASRNEVWRGLASIENNVDAPIQRLEKYVKKKS